MSHFIWYELMTQDIDAAIAFYGKVAGWTVTKSPNPTMDYRLIHAPDQTVGGQGVGGMMKAPMAEMPSAWVGYVNVADVDAEITAFEAAGGKLHWPANDIPGVGRMALVSDPQGAMLYVMTPTGEGKSEAFAPFGGGTEVHGHCGWNEYHAKDWTSALDFYAGRFGWDKVDEMDMGPMGKYVTFNAEGVLTGGMMNNPLPQQAWLFYFITGDIDAGVERITENGGAIQVPPMSVPGGMWATVAKDPQGAMFGLLGTRA